MKVLLLDKNLGEDDKTKEPLIWLNLMRLPNKGKDGTLYRVKKENKFMTACIHSKDKPMQFEEFKADEVTPGTLVNVSFGVNENTGKSYIAKVEVLKITGFESKDLYE